MIARPVLVIDDDVTLQLICDLILPDNKNRIQFRQAQLQLSDPTLAAIPVAAPR